MRIHSLAPYLLACGVAVSAACTSSPVKPEGSVTVTVAAPVAPANGAFIANSAQPVTLTVSNAVVTGSDAVTYTFEVAADAGFASKVFTKDVAQTAGQTSLRLDVLPAGQDYFWHVRATTGSTVGVFSSPIKFSIGPSVTIQTPTPLTPASGAVVATLRPTFTVSNAAHSGPVTALTYRFDIATTPTFSTIVITGTVPEGAGGQTSFTPSSDLSPSVTYFWHATAIDSASGVSSGFTASQLVTTAQPTRQAQLAAQEGLVLWPGAQPPGTNGKAVMGDNWDVQTAVAGPGGPLSGTVFTSPRLPLLRVFDLIDRGLNPQAAIDWLNGNGYSVDAVYYPAINVIGFDFEYLSQGKAGAWDLIIRVGG